MAINNFTFGSLVIILWNANGVLQHYGELEYTLHSRRIDVALITETHLKHTSKFFIKGYKTYRSDHPANRSQGGAAVLVKSTLQHHPAALQPPSNDIQAAGITISLHNVTLTISAIYCPPRFNLRRESFDALFSSLGTHFIAGGDYNAKHIQWGSRITNPRGRALLSSIQKNNFEIVTGAAPTYWPTATSKLPDLIDFFVNKGINHLYKSTENLTDLSSDHSPILFTLHSQPSTITPKPSLTANLYNWDLFRTNMVKNLNKKITLKTPSDVENAVEYFTTSVQSAAWNSSDPPKMRQNNNSLSYPLMIRELIQEKRRARGKWQRTRLQADKQIFNRLSNRLKKEISEFKNSKYQKRLENLSISDNSIWRETKKILKHIPQCPPLRRPDMTWAKTDSEKAELFSEHLSSVFKPNESEQDPDFIETINNNLISPMPLSLPPKPITVKEVRDAIKKLPP
jgi:predicted house-cleaning noncanonical NTP pyrophosphatase (MazG superfamily)